MQKSEKYNFYVRTAYQAELKRAAQVNIVEEEKMRKWEQRNPLECMLRKVCGELSPEVKKQLLNCMIRDKMK